MENNKRILIVDDEEKNLKFLDSLLEREGYEVLTAANGREAVEKTTEYLPDIVILDIIMPEMDGYEACRKIKENPDTRNTPIVMVTALNDMESKLKGLEASANDFISKPIDWSELSVRLRNLVKVKEYEDLLLHYNQKLEDEVRKRTDEIQALNERLETENVYLREEVRLQHDHGEIIGESEAIKGALSLVEQVAGTDSTVLILGETGTGKELLAQSIHNISKRKDRHMVKVNCAAMPSTLIESELFGHEKGAYTGATTTQAGRFEIADGSTIFLDEIGEMPLELQAKLLRVLQNGEFERLGSTKTSTVDVRVISATNRDLKQDVMDGKFRSDLYYRLNVFPIAVPPLRERCEDILPLIWFFVKGFEKRIGKKINTISKRDIQSLQEYSWPGNIRELRNIVERSMIRTTSQTLYIELPRYTVSVDSRKRSLWEIEKDHIISVLEETGWRIRGHSGASEILGLKPTTLDARMKKLGITRKDQ